MGNGAKLRLSWVMPPAIALRDRSNSSADRVNRLRNASSIVVCGAVIAIHAILVEPQRRAVGVGLSEDQWSIGSNGNGMLEVRAQAAVDGHGGPAVVQHAHRGRAKVDLGLDSQAHAGPQNRP